jgi:murein DD-endopeptidase MepM/ murein hydrolase activator NlpD
MPDVPVDRRAKNRSRAVVKILILAGLITLILVVVRPDNLPVARGEALWASTGDDGFESLISDSLFLYSPQVLDFDVQAFLDAQPGPLAGYVEAIDGSSWRAAESIQHNAMLFGVNPQLILVLLEAQNNLVTGPVNAVPVKKGLDGQMTFYNHVRWIAELALQAYDRGRYQDLEPAGGIEFQDGEILTISEKLNPGTYAVQATLAQLTPQEEWSFWVRGPNPLFVERFSQWFGDPRSEPDQANGLTAPLPAGYMLPFTPGDTWHYTGGPHNYAGGSPGCTFGGGCPRPWSAVDIAPPESIGCPSSFYPADRWIVAARGGTVIYSGQALVVIDHGDGWRTYYSHVSSADRRGTGGVNQGDRLGHPSCEVEPGGYTTGVHVHFAIFQVGVGFVNIQGSALSGWTVAETTHYNGTMTLGDLFRTATVGRYFGINDILDIGVSGACPQGGGVILYKHANYSCGGQGEGGGYVIRNNAGSQDVPGAFDNQASALRVPSGWSVRLYEHINRQGASVCRSGNDANFSGDTFDGTGFSLNDQVSSFEVYDNPNCVPPLSQDRWNVTYYKDKELKTLCSLPTTLDDVYLFKDWETEAPATGCNADNWSARYVRLFNLAAGTYDFYLGTDDWGRIKIDGDTVVDNWQWAGQHYASRTLPAGIHEITVEFADAISTARLSAWWKGPGYAIPQEVRQPGQWYAQYWGNREVWWDPVVLVNEGPGPLNHSWGDGGPGFGLPENRFSGRFEREVQFECGYYKFNISADDGVRFWVDGKLTLDKWFDRAGSYSVIVDQADGNHELKVEYYENGGDAAISLDWKLVLACPYPDPSLYFPVSVKNP